MTISMEKFWQDGWPDDINKPFSDNVLHFQVSQHVFSFYWGSMGIIFCWVCHVGRWTFTDVHTVETQMFHNIVL